MATERGEGFAQHKLGLLYARGLGVPRDYVQAHMGFDLSASRSSGDDREASAKNLALAASLMTSAQIADAQRRVREWDAAHPREP